MEKLCPNNLSSISNFEPALFPILTHFEYPYRIQMHKGKRCHMKSTNFNWVLLLKRETTNIFIHITRTKVFLKVIILFILTKNALLNRIWPPYPIRHWIRFGIGWERFCGIKRLFLLFLSTKYHQSQENVTYNWRITVNKHFNHKLFSTEFWFRASFKIIWWKLRNSGKITQQWCQ